MPRCLVPLGLLFITGCGGPPPVATPAPGPAARTGPTAAADASLLFVGNSHTAFHDLPTVVAGMVRHLRPGRPVHARYVPVAFLEDTATDPTAADAVAARPWTAVVLQAQKISVSGTVDYPRAAGLELARRAKARGAAVVFYPEWGLKGKAGDGARQEAVYRAMAREAGVQVAPVATAWDLALTERPELALHADDGNHQSPLGAFLTACVLAGRLAGVSPAPLATYPYPAGDADRAFLADIAARALADG